MYISRRHKTCKVGIDNQLQIKKGIEERKRKIPDKNPGEGPARKKSKNDNVKIIK